MGLIEKIFDIIFPFVEFKIYYFIQFSKYNPKNFRDKVRILLRTFLLQLILFIPVLLNRFYNVYIKFKKIGAKKKSIGDKSEIRKVGIYSPRLDKYSGGGEKVGSYFALFFEERYPNAEIIIVHDDSFGQLVDEPISREIIYSKYGVKLNRTKAKIYKNKYDQIFHYNYLYSFLKMTQEFDVFVNCDMNLFPSMSALNFNYIHFPLKYNKLESNFTFKMYKKSYDSFIANSDYTSFWIKKYYQIENSNVIYPCIYIPDLSLPLPKKNIILSVSRIANEKKIEVMIDIFQSNLDKFENYELHIVGSINPDDNKYYEYLKSFVKIPQIKFFLNLTIEDLRNKYLDAKIFWSAMGFGLPKDYDPYKFEHFGLTVAEALSYGVVPVVIENGGPAEMVKKGNCGLTWFKKDDLVSQTLILINDEKYYEILQTNAIQFSKNFHKEVFFDSFEKLLNDAIDVKMKY